MAKFSEMSPASAGSTAAQERRQAPEAQAPSSQPHLADGESCKRTTILRRSN